MEARLARIEEANLAFDFAWITIAGSLITTTCKPETLLENTRGPEEAPTYEMVNRDKRGDFLRWPPRNGENVIAFLEHTGTRIECKAWWRFSLYGLTLRQAKETANALILPRLIQETSGA